jgi:hypothetical protein
MADSILVGATKACSACKQVKNLSMFGKNKNNPDGYQYSCKLCRHNYYQESKGKALVRQRDYQRRNKEQVRVSRQKYYKKTRSEEVYVLRKLLAKAKERAKAKGLFFDLTIEWLETMVVSHCPITLQPIDWLKEQVVDGRTSPNSPSIDKNIPELGYVQSNCAIISHRGNTIKNNGTIDEHRRVVQYMAAQQLRDTEF